jgi:hypothetical protein
MHILRIFREFTFRIWLMIQTNSSRKYFPKVVVEPETSPQINSEDKTDERKEAEINDKATPDAELDAELPDPPTIEPSSTIEAPPKRSSIDDTDEEYVLVDKDEATDFDEAEKVKNAPPKPEV